MHPVAAVQSEYSLWWRDREHDVIPVLEELGIGLVPYSPLGRGFLTGTIDTTTAFAASDLRASMPRFQHDAMAANRALVDVLDDIARQAEATSAQVAIACLLAQHPWIVPIPGPKRASRVEENTAAANLTLSDVQLQQIRQAADLIPIVGNRYPEHLDRLTNL